MRSRVLLNMIDCPLIRAQVSSTALGRSGSGVAVLRMTGWRAVLFLTSLLSLSCGSGRPTIIQVNPPANSQVTASPEPAAVNEPLAQEPQSKEPENCAEVGIGLDLRALPQPVSDADVRMYTLGQADDFRQTVPTTTRVEIYMRDGVAAFTAKLYSTSEPDLVAICSSIAEEFIAGVPGHPLAIGESGGSIIEPCALCHEESGNASSTRGSRKISSTENISPSTELVAAKIRLG